MDACFYICFQDAVYFDKNTKGIARGPNTNPITPQNAVLAPLFLAR